MVTLSPQNLGELPGPLNLQLASQELLLLLLLLLQPAAVKGQRLTPRTSAVSHVCKVLGARPGSGPGKPRQAVLRRSFCDKLLQQRLQPPRVPALAILQADWTTGRLVC